MKRLKKILLSRRIMVILLLIVQFMMMTALLFSGDVVSEVISAIISAASAFVIVYVVNRRDKPAYKITWIILMLAIPVFGTLFYLVLTMQARSGNSRKYVDYYVALTSKNLTVNRDVNEELASLHPQHISQVNYLSNYAKFPLYNNTDAEYFSPGEKFFPRFKQELEKAERFIFLEFFIIERGRMWNETLEILKRKAAQGVEVRLMYDDIGCLTLLEPDYCEKMKKLGIKCVAFNRFRALWSSVQNNRDHRKIVVIDGKVCFTGGVNIADEYINEVERFGYWQDCAILIKGAAVKSFTVMFLSQWGFAKSIKEDFTPYLIDTPEGKYDNGYFLPYADTPLDDENICEHVYMQILNQAREYVYIETPYFIVDDSMLSAFRLAAKSGVDVRIITPHIPDKKLVHLTTRSYYQALIEAGVRVYEFTPGFIHSKTVVSDDDIATVGTANFDFRSLYLHFECGTLVFNSSVVSDMKKEFFATLEKCHEITEKDLKTNIFVHLWQSLLRLIAPLF